MGQFSVEISALPGSILNGNQHQSHNDFSVVAIASRSFTSAAHLAATKGLKSKDTESLLTDDLIDLIINLTPPSCHFDLTRAALENGKHVYSEKPLATSMAQADSLIQLADQRGLLLACAPATFMGPAWNHARSMIAEGKLGRIVGAAGAIVYPGPNLFHHNPEHLFSDFGGPVFDMGVYHVCVLVSLLGRVREVQAMMSPGKERRSVNAGPRAGQTFSVTVPTHVACILKFESGPVASLTLSFEGFGSRAPGLEIVGDKGAICLPQAGQFSGPVMASTELFKWSALDNSSKDVADADWVIGPVDSWRRFIAGESIVPNAYLARHTLDVMLSIEAAARTGEPHTVTSNPSDLSSSPRLS